jgi:hypothetical protein
MRVLGTNRRVPEERPVDDAKLRWCLLELPDADVQRTTLQRYVNPVCFVGRQWRMPEEPTVHDLAMYEVLQLLLVGYDSMAWLSDARKRTNVYRKYCICISYKRRTRRLAALVF